MKRCSALLFLLLSSPAGAQTCDVALAQFRRLLDADVATGHVHKSVYDRIIPELARIGETCRSGRDPQALNALSALKRRHGYR